MTQRGDCLHSMRKSAAPCVFVSKMWVQTCSRSVAGCKHDVARVCARLWNSLAGMGGSFARVKVGAGRPGNWLCCS